MKTSVAPASPSLCAERAEREAIPDPRGTLRLERRGRRAGRWRLGATAFTVALAAACGDTPAASPVDGVAAGGSGSGGMSTDPDGSFPSGPDAAGAQKDGSTGSVTPQGDGAVDLDSTEDAGGAEADSRAPAAAGSVGPPFVAVGYGAVRAYSADGKAWTTASDPAPLPAGWAGPPVSGDNQWLLRGGCYGQNQFLAVGGTGGDQGLVLRSSDGMDWTVVPPVHANDDCAFGNGVWVTPTRWSTDAAHWLQATESAQTRAMVFGGGLFVAVGDQSGGGVSYTADGKAWSHLQIGFVGTGSNRKGYNVITYGAGTFLASNNFLQTSPVFTWDGKDPASFTETSRAAFFGENTDITAVAYGRHSLVVATPGHLFVRKDGQAGWTKVSYAGAGQLNNLVVTDDLYLTDRAWSADGVTWHAATTTPSDGINKVIGTPR